MAIHEHETHFAGKIISDWEPHEPPGAVCRISLSWDEGEKGKEWTDKFHDFLEHPMAKEVTGLVIGPWDLSYSEVNSELVIRALAAASPRLPKLTAIFLGDITMEESEISWIQQSDVSPLFRAYSDLEYFCVRGGSGLSLRSLQLGRLRSLVVQTGGLDAGVVRQVASAQLPSLEHLELWLGEDGYGANYSIDDLQPILNGSLFPRLTHLGLRDSEKADEIAKAVAISPILPQLKVLDLSLGTLGDEGARALLANPATRDLDLLDIHFHYVSDEVVRLLEESGIEVDASDRQEEDKDDGRSFRYVAVSE